MKIYAGLVLLRIYYNVQDSLLIFIKLGSTAQPDPYPLESVSVLLAFSSSAAVPSGRKPYWKCTQQRIMGQ